LFFFLLKESKSFKTTRGLRVFTTLHNFVDSDMESLIMDLEPFDVILSPISITASRHDTTRLPRNFPADLLATSPTSWRLVTDKSLTCWQPVRWAFPHVTWRN